MSEHVGPSEDTNSLRIDFNSFIQPSRRLRSETERQVTICRYRTYTPFDPQRIERAIDNCWLKPGEDLGVIDVRMHSDGNGHEEMSDVDSQANVSTIQSLRALFGLIGDGYFRWLDSETRDIYEYAIRGVLKETFLTEYYANASKELEFLTYGGSQHEAQITTKHERCFGLSLHAQLMEFDYDFVRSICLKPEFKYTLKRIVYLPRGRADYGTVEKAFMQSKYRNVIDPDAERVKDILEDPDVLIDEFTARLVISTSETRSSITIRFDFTKRGRITLYLPEIEFWKQMSQIEFENRFYDIVRMAYFRITGLDISAMPAQRSEMEVYEQPYLDLDQAFDDFLEDG